MSQTTSNAMLQITADSTQVGTSKSSKTKNERARNLFNRRIDTAHEESNQTKTPRRTDGTKPTSSSNAPIALSATGLVKSYRRGKVEVPVLRGVDFAAKRGEITSIIGQSGSGKSTLLHLLATLDRPDEGEITYGNQRIDNLRRGQRDRFRNEELGMIFQFYHLLPELTMLENVLAPVMIGCGLMQYFRERSKLKQRALELLDLVELSHRVHHRPYELSGGEMQRTAIARALISQPNILLADEPTGNLDSETGDGVLEILQLLNREQGLTIVMVTHDNEIAQSAHTCVRLTEGKVADC